MEMLIVIAIIAVLAGVAGPALTNALFTAKVNGAMQQGRQIGLGLTGYAMDYSGYFPRGTNDSGENISSSNAAFRSLRDYIADERVFAVASSNWGHEADNNKDQGQFLAPGENHFSYIAGLSSTSMPYYPLVVDGTNGSGTYTRDQTARGGCWQGKKGVVIRVDGSGSVVPMKGGDNERFIPRMEKPDQNALETSYMGQGITLLDPEG